MKYYVLDIGLHGADVRFLPARFPVRLLVARITASHLYRDDRLVYGSGPVQLGTYEYERWAEPPADMIQDMLISSLARDGSLSFGIRHQQQLREEIISSAASSMHLTK